ncbi:DNA repair protein RAD5A-like [Selaginella moellendorffii]|uniref:DNA repair protein RAD5A-like n=1 Tax=Selaginella moellendorffii TaxID=88036 RepID=UPI000D1CD1B6|nr:DNA repair protein RAD5A-like [Selaginella moellendorffii]|eukprot:XP_024522215.1 DNA repair protein RAD5A-like [Selaginella moellendorffii]
MEAGCGSVKAEASVSIAAGCDPMKVDGLVKMEAGFESARVKAPVGSVKMEPGYDTVKVETPFGGGKAAHLSEAKVVPIENDTAKAAEKQPVVLDAERWWLLQETEVAGYSTSRGCRIRVGEFVSFNFPKPEAESKKKFFEHKKVRPKASSDIVRFLTKASGEIGRLPADWAKCLIPLGSAKWHQRLFLL